MTSGDDGVFSVARQMAPPGHAGHAGKGGHVGHRRDSEVTNKSTADLLPARRTTRSLPWNIGWSVWCRKYFWEDKGSPSSQNPALPDASKKAECGQQFLTEHRRLIGVAVPALLVQFVWVCVMVRYDLWYLFPKRYALTLIMVIASILAGLTSIGGGAIAFPVLTLLLNVTPDIARDFALLIQSCGMTSAAFTIFFMGVSIEWWALLFGSLGGAIGLILGLEYVEGQLLPEWKKMIFSSFWFSFAFALFFLNRYRKRKTFTTIPSFTWWKGLVLIVTGMVGGVFTSFVGAGVDICSLSVLTLFFRVSEKTATPTSVVLMAFNSILGSFWRGAIMTSIEVETWRYVAVSAAVAVVGAPVGSVLGTRLHRQVLACIIYIIVTVTLITSFALVPQTPLLAGASVAIIFTGFGVFFGLTLLGQRLMNSICPQTEDEEERRSYGSSECSTETVTGTIIKPMDQGHLTISHL